MKKKTNVIKRNSGFIVGCVLAAGASFVAADTLMSEGIPTVTRESESAEGETTETIAPETSTTRTYETDPFTVTASGNIIKGVESETESESETDAPQTDENGNPVTETGQTDENGNLISGTNQSQDGSAEGSGTDGEGYYEGSGTGSDGYSDGGSTGGDGYSDGGSSGGGYYEQPIEIYDPGNGDYYYTDNSGSGSGSGGGSGSSGSGSGGGSGSGSSSAWTPDDVILWGISSRYIDESELYNYSAAQLRLIRNEIFALHGRIFNSQDLMDYFSQKSWYVPTYAPEDFDANMFYYLNDYEEANLQVILNYEDALARY